VLVQDLHQSKKPKCKLSKAQQNGSNTKGITQGSIFSPGLFNLYSEYIIKTGGVDDMVTGIGKVI
jgi:hypothetical protein